MSRAEIQAELWRRGNLKWKLHSAQEQIYNRLKAADKKLFVINCSRRFGKSFLMALMAIELALQKKKQRIKFATAYQTDLKELILPIFEQILSDCPSTHRPTYQSNASKYCFPNGSEIKLIGVDKRPNALRGTAIDYIILDEAGFIDNLEYLYQSVVIPATMYRDKAKVVMISTPPVSPNHAFVKYCEKATAEGNYAKFTIDQNPMVSAAEMAELEREAGGRSSTQFRREYLCEFVTEAGRAIIPEWNDSYIQDYPRPDLFKFLHLYEGMDLGVKDLTVCIFGYYDFKNAKLIIEDELVINGPELTTEKLAKLIKDKEQQLWSNKQVYYRVADNNNLMLLNDLGSLHQLNFVGTSKDTLEAMVNNVRLWVNNGRIIINPRCTQLIGCLRYGVFNKNRTEFERSSTYGHYDALAALIYLVRNIRENANPYPTYIGKSHDVIILDDPQESSRKALEKAFVRKSAFSR